MKRTATIRRQWQQRSPDFLPGHRVSGIDVDAGDGWGGSKRKHNMKSKYATLVMGLALSAAAQTSGQPQHQVHDPLHQPFIAAALDANKDGIIDATEQANAPAALAALDQNRNGQLEMSEVMSRPANERIQPASPPAHSRRPARPAPDDGAHSVPAAPPHMFSEPGTPPPPPPVPAIITALDANQDGLIDAAELANAQVALKTLDKNGDGQLTPDEYHPMRQPRPGRVLRHEPGGSKQREHSAAAPRSAPPAQE